MSRLSSLIALGFALLFAVPASADPPRPMYTFRILSELITRDFLDVYETLLDRKRLTPLPNGHEVAVGSDGSRIRVASIVRQTSDVSFEKLSSYRLVTIKYPHEIVFTFRTRYQFEEHETVVSPEPDALKDLVHGKFLFFPESAAATGMEARMLFDGVLTFEWLVDGLRTSTRKLVVSAHRDFYRGLVVTETEDEHQIVLDMQVLGGAEGSRHYGHFLSTISKSEHGILGTEYFTYDGYPIGKKDAVGIIYGDIVYGLQTLWQSNLLLLAGVIE